MHVFVVWPLVLHGVAADGEPVDIGCVDSDSGLVRRCLELFDIDWQWIDAAAWCELMFEGKLVVVDSPDIEQNLTKALKQQPDRPGGYKAWISGQRLVQQTDWIWINGQSFEGQLASSMFELHLLHGYLAAGIHAT